MNLHKKFRFLVSMTSIFVTGAMTSLAASAEDGVYPFVDVGVSQPAPEMFGLNDQYKFSLAPNLAVGIAKDYQLAADWLLTNSLALNAQQADFYVTNQENTKVYGDIKQYGIVAGTSLKYAGLSDKILPFVAVEAGVFDATMDYNNQRHSELQKSYKVSTGIEFKTSNDSAFSISVGYADELGSNTFQ